MSGQMGDQSFQQKPNPFFFDENEQLKHAEEKLKLAKFEYFQQQILYDAFREAVNKLHLRNVKSFTKQDNTLRLMEKKLAIVEAVSYLRGNIQTITLKCTKEQIQSAVFDLKEEDLETLMKGINLDDSIVSKEILPDISKCIVNKGNVISTFFNDINRSSLNEKLSNIVPVVRSKANLLEELQTNTVDLNVERQQLLKDYFMELVEAFNTLLIVMEEFPLNLQSESIKQRVEIAKEKLVSVSDEAEFLKLQLLQKLYTVEQQKTLNQINFKIDEKRSEVEGEIFDMTSQLNSYLELGEDFLNLANEYGKIKSEYDILKWADYQYL